MSKSISVRRMRAFDDAQSDEDPDPILRAEISFAEKLLTGFVAGVQRWDEDASLRTLSNDDQPTESEQLIARYGRHSPYLPRPEGEMTDGDDTGEERER